MKRAIFVLLSIVMGWTMGCATPQLEAEDAATTGAVQQGNSSLQNANVKPASPRMRAPAPAAAVLPSQPQSGGPEATTTAADGTVTQPPILVEGAYRLNIGDPIIATFRGIPSEFSIEDIVDEKGMISLPYIGDVRAVDQTTSELEKTIFDLYVPDYYRYMSVNVIMPNQRSYYVQGAVRGPGKHLYTAGVSLMQAISTAGGYTDFADRKKVKLVRAGETMQYNMIEIEKNPDSDVLLQPADQIIVPEKWY